MFDAQARILIFAKAPVPGRVKTRLVPALGRRGAADLQRLLIEHTLAGVAGSGLCPAQCWCWPDPADAAFAPWGGHPHLSFHRQCAGDLGTKMRLAAASALAAAQRVLLIGVDCPLLGAELLREALALLQHRDAVIGPAQDGGYVLLGLRRAEPLLFDGMPWGGPEVLAQTRCRMSALGWRWTELPVLWDVDRVEDLERLRALDQDWARRVNRLSAAR